jgi:hypothetical protein
MPAMAGVGTTMVASSSSRYEAFSILLRAYHRSKGRDGRRDTLQQ